MSDPIELWQLYTDDPNELRRLLRQLPHLDDAAIRAHILHLATVNPQSAVSERVYFEALDVLKRFYHPEFLPPMANLLHHPSEIMRRGAVRFLEHLKDERVVEVFIEALGYTHGETLASIVGFLAKRGDPRTFDAFVALLQDDDQRVRRGAAQGLGMIGDPRAVAPLIHALSDEAEMVNRYAAEALSKLGDQRAIEPLLPLLEDDRYWVWASAIGALEKFADPRLIPIAMAWLYHPDKEHRSSALYTLSLFVHDYPAIVEALMAFLTDTGIPMDKDSHQIRAIQLLGRSGDRRVVDFILPYLHHADNKDVRITAVRALGNLPDPRVIPALHPCLHDSSSGVRLEVVEALGNIGTGEAILLLREALDDTSIWLNQRIGSYAAQTLEKIGTPEALAVLDSWKQSRYGGKA